MSHLYNLWSTETGYRITKFDSDLNVLSTYNVTEKECDCPAGFRPTCRHRQMLPALKPILDNGWFYNFDQKQYTNPNDAPPFALVSSNNDHTPLEGTDP